MKFAMFAMSAISCAASVTTLVVVLVGAKRLEAEMEGVKVKTTSNIAKLKNSLTEAINNLDS